MTTREQAEATSLQQKKIVRMPEVMAITGLKKTAINSRIKAGTFVPKINLGGRAIGFLESDLSDWLDKRIADSKKVA